MSCNCLKIESKGGYYKGHPACIKHPYGNGAAYYYGSAFSVPCVKELMKERGIFSVAEELVVLSGILSGSKPCHIQTN